MASEWREIALAEVAMIASGKRPPVISRDPTSTCRVPIIGGGGPSGFTEAALYNKPILITGRVGTLGKLFASRDPCWPSDNALVIQPSDTGTDAKFLRYALQLVISDAAGMNRGAANPLITQGDLGRLVIRHPPLPFQRAIAHILGTLDDKIELNRRMNVTLEAMARALFKSWFVDFDPVRAKAEGREPGLTQPLDNLFSGSFEESELGKIPKGWEAKTLSDICDKPQYGYTASASDEPVGPRFLRITDINKRDWIEWDGVPFCSIDSEQKGRYTLMPGDIVIARMADPGHGALIEEEVDAVFASYLIRFRPQRHELARYLQYWLRSNSYWDKVRSMQSGTTRANLNATVLGSFGLVVPPGKVLQVFDQSARSLRERVVANARESRALAALRDTLLPKLISGALRLKDAKQIIERAAS